MWWAALLNSLLGTLSSGVPTGSYESIASASPAGSMDTTFSSIPTTYKHLQIRFYMPNCTTAPGNLWYYPNGNTTANKTLHELNGTGTVQAAAVTGLPWNRICYQNVANNYPMVSITDILDYSSATKNKTTRVFWGNEPNAVNSFVALTTGYIPITAAFTSITVGRDSGNFPTGTSIALYGIKG
jgi:hypothetical protein